MLRSVHYSVRPVGMISPVGVSTISPVTSIRAPAATEPVDEELASQFQQNPVINQVQIYQALKANNATPYISHPAPRPVAVQAEASVDPIARVQQNEAEEPPLPLYDKHGRSHNSAPVALSGTAVDLLV